MPRRGNQFFFVANTVLPAPPYEGGFSCIYAQSIPYIVGALELRIQPYTFEPGSVTNGIQLLREAQLSVVTPCQGFNKLYALLDNALNGTTYTADEDGVLSPAIPDAPTGEYVPDSVRGQLAALLEGETEEALDIEALLAQAELIATLLG